MPVSSNSGKPAIQWVISKLPCTDKLLDIGAGVGTYAKLFKAKEWTGVEVWEPYVERYGLQDFYNNLIIADAKEIEFTDHFDVAFAGDVLEHMTKEEALTLFNKLRACSDTVIISIPIGYHPQGDWGGNPYERHIVDNWSVDTFIGTFGQPTFMHHEGVIGVFVYSNHPIEGDYEVEKDTICRIPKTIHIVWVGDETKRPDDCIATWRDKNPEWTIKVWSNKEFEEKDWLNKDHMKAVWDSQIYGVADMMRYEILYEHGGFCIDADSVCEQPLDDEMFNAETVLFYENEVARPNLIANGYMASMPNNEFFLRIAEDIKADATIPSQAACMATGPFRLTDAVKKYNPNVKIMPSHLFMPEHHTGQKYKGDGKIYGRQFWGSSGKKEPLKICVYAISKNEEQFVERFANAAKDADLIMVADTGSTDGTVAACERVGIAVHSICITPWRFDHARNAALALLPRDIDVCISLDLDEVLEPGWREEIERVWEKGKTTRLEYFFDWGHGIKFRYQKIHARHGYFWHHPCHEYPVNDKRIEEVWAYTDKLLVTHHPDPTKSRGQYLDLLELSVKEDPYCPRNAFYHSRELTFYGKWQEAVDALHKYLKMPEATWPNERCYAMRLLGKAYDHLGNYWEAVAWLRRACAEAPNTREPWCDLAMFLYRRHEWVECYGASLKALSIKDKQLVYTCDPLVWGSWAHDLASISAWHLGHKDEAMRHCRDAIEADPNDDRLKANLKWMENALNNPAEEQAGSQPDVDQGSDATDGEGERSSEGSDGSKTD